MAWAIHFHPEVAEWLRGLGLRDLHRVTAAIDALTAVGPGLGRPLVGYIRTSRHSAMKELRPPGTHFRVLFAFDEERQAGDVGGRGQAAPMGTVVPGHGSSRG